MKNVMQINKKNIWMWVTMVIIIGIFIFILCMKYIFGIRGSIELDEEEGQNMQNITDAVDEGQYMEFENLFREHKEDMCAFVELSQESILSENSYLILFDEKWYLSMLSGNPLEEYLIILFYNNSFVLEGEKEIADSLNKNDDLIRTLNAINEKGVIVSVQSFYLAGSIQMLTFAIDSSFTAFIDDSGALHRFGYCTDVGCEKYGYKNIEDNWYMYIAPIQE